MRQRQNKKWRMPGVLVAVVMVIGSGLMSVAVVAENLKDPTRPLFEGVDKSDNSQDVLKLESILISGDRKVAVINGQAVTEKQIVAGARVEKILPGRVVVLHQEKQKSLMLMAPVRSSKK